MVRLRQAFQRTDLGDALSGLAALVYLLGFVAAIEAALGRLAY